MTKSRTDDKEGEIQQNLALIKSNQLQVEQTKLAENEFLTRSEGQQILA